MRWLDGITDSMDLSLIKLPRDGEGQGRLVCCSPWGRTDSDMTEQLKNNSLYIYTYIHTHTQGGERFIMRIGSYRYGG